MDIHKLIKNKEKKQDYKDELFKKILLQCHRRIEYSSNVGDLYSIFTIPEYVVGFPLFNKSECCEYLIKSLNDNGFIVQSYSNNYIYITWAHVYESYKENKELDKKMIDYKPEVSFLEQAQQQDKPLDKINSLILNQNNKFSILK